MTRLQTNPLVPLRSREHVDKADKPTELFYQDIIKIVAGVVDFDGNDVIGIADLTMTGELSLAVNQYLDLEAGAGRGRIRSTGTAGVLDYLGTNALTWTASAVDLGVDLDLNSNDITNVALLNTRDPDDFLLHASTSVNNTIPRFDGTGGKTIQNSGVTISDLNSLGSIAAITMTGTLATPAGITMTGALATPSSITTSGNINCDGDLDLVTLGNRIDFDEDNDTSLRCDVDDVLIFEALGIDIFNFSLSGITALSTLGDIRLDGKGTFFFDDDEDSYFECLSDDTMNLFVGGSNRCQWTNSLMTISTECDFTSTDNIKIPVGTTAQRPGSPAQGDVRYNSTLGMWEGYDGSAWGALCKRMFNHTFGDASARSSSVYLRVTGNHITQANAGYTLTAAGELRAIGVTVNITTATAGGVLTYTIYLSGSNDTTLDVTIDASSTGWKHGSTRVAVGSGISFTADEWYSVRAVETTGPIVWDDGAVNVEGEYVEDY